MNNPPFFSVVIPTYNREDIIKNAIDSVLNQTYDNFEIIVIDNGSTDNTRQSIESYSKNKIKYFYQTGSGSPASPRNAGIRSSSAPWVCFLDSDDYWLPNKLEFLKKTIEENSKLDVIYHYEIMINQSNGKKSLLSQSRALENVYQDMLENGNKLSTSATSIRRSFLKSHQLFFNENHDFDIVEDYDLWLRVANKKANFYLLKEVLGVYVVNGNNLISDWNLYLRNLQNLYHKHIYEIQDYEKNTGKLWKLKLIEIDLLKMGYYFRSNQYILLFILCLKTIFNNPFYFYLVLFKKFIKKKFKGSIL
jgi:glycosyltransferase involved in cell wall biosynthesis